MAHSLEALLRVRGYQDVQGVTHIHDFEEVALLD